MEEKAITELKNQGTLEMLSETYGDIIFLNIEGSYGFGFPSPNSDLDIRGVYVAPTSRFLRNRDKLDEPTFVSSKGNLEISVDEVGHYLKLVSKSNGPRFEWLFSNVFHESPEFSGLREIVSSYGLSKKLAGYYQRYPKTFIKGGKLSTNPKDALHALRAYMTGIHLYEDGEVVSDISTLNQSFNLPFVAEVLNLKKEGSPVSEVLREEIMPVIELLSERLAQSLINSDLPEQPNTEAMNDYLESLRKSNL